MGSGGEGDFSSADVNLPIMLIGASWLVNMVGMPVIRVYNAHTNFVGGEISSVPPRIERLE